MRVKLQHVAHARSGDKGNTANMAVFDTEIKDYQAQVTNGGAAASYLMQLTDLPPDTTPPAGSSST